MSDETTEDTAADQFQLTARREALDAVVRGFHAEVIDLGALPVAIGLREQGHIATVERMLRDGKSWDEIGAAIHWHGPTAQQWWSREVVGVLGELRSQVEQLTKERDEARDVSDFWSELAEWSRATFGHDVERGPRGPLLHLRKETDEALAEVDLGNSDALREEIGDCFSIILDAARRSGMSWADLLAEARRKLAINRSRTWSRPTTDEPAEHVR